MPLIVDAGIDTGGEPYAPPAFPRLFADAGYCGRSFNGGLLRFHDAASAAEFTPLVRAAFPEITDPDAGVVAFDWLGRQYVSIHVGGAAEDAVVIHRADVGYGDLIDVVPVPDFAGALRGDVDPLFDGELFAAFRTTTGQAAHGLAFAECVEYSQPIFLGGADTIDNMAVIDTSVSWTIGGQLRAQTHDLPVGTQVTATAVLDERTVVGALNLALYALELEGTGDVIVARRAELVRDGSRIAAPREQLVAAIRQAARSGVPERTLVVGELGLPAVQDFVHRLAAALEDQP